MLSNTRILGLDCYPIFQKSVHVNTTLIILDVDTIHYLCNRLDDPTNIPAWPLYDFVAYSLQSLNPLTAAAAYIRVFILY